MAIPGNNGPLGDVTPELPNRCEMDVDVLGEKEDWKNHRNRYSQFKDRIRRKLLIMFSVFIHFFFFLA